MEHGRMDGRPLVSHVTPLYLTPLNEEHIKAIKPTSGRPCFLPV